MKTLLEKNHEFSPAVLGVGASKEEAQEKALTSCSNKNSGVIVSTCQVVGSFTSNDTACVGVVNGGRRIGTEGHNFYAVREGDSWNLRASVMSRCKRAGQSQTGWDCRYYEEYCRKDALAAR